MVKPYSIKSDINNICTCTKWIKNVKLLSSCAIYRIKGTIERDSFEDIYNMYLL